MKIVKTKSEITTLLQSADYAGKTIGFVPTMGALHIGHASLIRLAKRENNTVVASIFVNPTQFNDNEDLANYPRTFDTDLALLEKAGCNVLFCPEPDDMYRGEFDWKLPELSHLTDILEGKYRPNHFKGVMKIVARLFQCILPDKAYFGEKDYQQLVIIQEMTNRLKLKTSIVGCPTFRADNGLALSSRNSLLTSIEQKQGGIIYTAINIAANTFINSGLADAKKQYYKDIEETGAFKVEYLIAIESENLKEATNYNPMKNYRLITAVLASKARLIDNIRVKLS
jgi:pantoate--beta-alanine ligase